jgi:hypothetical protein
VLKYDSSGAMVRDRAFDFDTDDGATGAACDSAGNIYAAGYTGTPGTHDCLLMKLDSTGSILWTTTYGGSADDGASDVACDAAGNPVIAGWATDSLAYDAELLIVKHSPFTGLTESTGAGPIPARTHRTITAAPELVLSVPCSGRYDIRLSDLCGRTRQSVFSGLLIQGTHRISLVGRPAGLYFVRVAAPDGGVSCQSLVLVR